MKNNSAYNRRILAASSAIMLLFFLDSCTKDEIFTSGMVNEFTLQSTANGASYEIKVGMPANYNPSAEKYAKNYVMNSGHMDSRNPNIIKGLTYYFLNR